MLLAFANNIFPAFPSTAPFYLTANIKPRAMIANVKPRILSAPTGKAR